MPDTFVSTQTSLLDDLLEASEAHYHRNCAVIQRVVWAHYFRSLADREAKKITFCAEALRRVLKQKQEDLIQEQRTLKEERQRSIRAYVVSLTGCEEAAA